LAFLSSHKGALTSVAGGGVLNSINFSTAFHRLARHSQYSNPQRNNANFNAKNDRSKVLTDPRFAFLLCSAAEAMMQNPNLFNAREMSNIAWALAKFKIAPPQRVMAVETSEQVEDRLREKSAEIRSQILQVAKQRQQGAGSDPTTPWIPALSELSGLLLDSISYRVMASDPNLFQLQEWANLLWALATAGRGDSDVFAFVLSSLIRGKQAQDSNEGLSAQEWSNSIWALATAGFLGPEQEFLPFVANMMNENPGDFMDSFKPQELSNTVWGVATIISKRPGQPVGAVNDAALDICRHVAKQVIKRQGQGFKSQETTNTAWALATLGFGIVVDLELAERSDYKCLQTNDLEGDAQLAATAVQVVYQHAKENIFRYRPQELNNLSWIMARMDVTDFELMELLAKEMGNPRRKVMSQDLGTTLWGMASSKFDQPELYRAVAARWTPEMAARAKPQELSNAVWALATADVTSQYPDAFDTTILNPEQRRTPTDPKADPVTTCFALAAQELMQRPQQFKTQEIKDVLWAFSRNGIRHPRLFRAMAEHLVGVDATEGLGFQEFSVQAVGNTAWAYARQAQLGADTKTRFKDKTCMPRSSGRLAHYMVLASDVGEDLIRKLFLEIAETDLNKFGKIALSRMNLMYLRFPFSFF